MQALVPSFVSQAYAAGLHHGRLNAVAMQVDVSGFTQMTNTIMSHDREAGSEVVADLMRVVFNPLVDLVDLYGGFVAMFAGDAFTAIFPFRIDETDRSQVVSRALTAVWLMQSRLKDLVYHSDFGEFRFNVKIGVAEGQIDWRVFPNQEIGHEVDETARTIYNFSGPAMNRSIQALALCDGGVIVVSLDMVNGDELVHTAPIAGSSGFVYLVMVTQFAERLPTNPYELAIQDRASLRPFVPLALQEKNVVGEFRQVVSVFIGVHDQIEELSQLTPFVNLVYELQATYGGYLNALRFDDKGCVAVLFWGAPVGSENDIARAVSFAYELKHHSPYNLKIGITYRWLYAGLIGSDKRQDYSCYGGGTSLAARLMVEAPPQEIWLDEAIASRIEAQFDQLALGQQSLKGFKEPQPIYRLGQSKEVEIGLEYDQVFVGRRHELARLYAFMQPIFDGRFSGVFIVRGEAGSGKSRLTYEVRQQLEAEYPNQFAWSYCQADEIIRTELNPFRYFLQRYFQQSPEESDAQNKERFATLFRFFLIGLEDEAIQLELERTRSFLGALIGLYWEDSLYARVSPLLRKENTQRGLIAFFRALCHFVPVVLHIEDAHWFDETSARFVGRLAERLDQDAAAHPFCILITMRDPVDVAWEQIAQLLEAVPMESFTINRFGPEDIYIFATNMLKQDVSPEFVTFLSQRTDNNPFFVEQTILYLQEQNLLELDGHQLTITADSLEISSDIRAVLLARIDRLMPQVQEMVQTAAVLGREFSLNVLRHMLTDDTRFQTHVREAHEADIWVKLVDSHYLFKHALLRDMAYHMQLQRRRQELHKRAFDAILTLYQADLTPYYGELAYHAEQAQLIRPAIEHLQKAGALAEDAYQNDSAINYYKRSVDLLAGLDDHESDTLRFDILAKLAHIYYLYSHDYVESEAIAAELGRAVRRLGDPLKLGEVFSIYSGIHRMKANYLLALSYAQQALVCLDPAVVPKKHAKILDKMALIYRYQVRYEIALHYSLQSLTLLKQGEPSRELASAYTTVGICYNGLGDYQTALEMYRQAQQLYQALNDDSGYANAASNIGFIYGLVGEYDRAIACYEEGLTITVRIGMPRLVVRMVGNLGRLLGQIGDFAAAQSYFEQALQIAHQINAKFELCWVQSYIATMYFKMGRLEEASLYSNNSLTIADQLPHIGYIVANYLRNAQIAHEQGDLSGAVKILDQLDQRRLSATHQADLFYTRWLITGEAASGRAALSAYQQFVKETPKIDYIERIDQLLLRLEV